MPCLSIQSASNGSAGSVVSVFCLSTPFIFTKSIGFARPVSGLFALSVSVLFASAPSTSAQSASTLFASVGTIVPMSNSSALSTSALSVFAPSASSGSAVFISGLFVSASPVFRSIAFSGSVVTPTQGRQKLIELNQREKRVTSEELALVFIPLLPFEPLFLFPASCIGKKLSFDKAFNIKCWLLAKNQFGKDVDLSFAGY